MRTDVHSPKNLVTEDYEYVFSEVNHLDERPGWVYVRGSWGLEMSRWIARTDKLGRGTGQCHHCGAAINYFAVLRHIPTGDAVVVGETCLGNRFDQATADFHRLRKQAKLDRERQRVLESRRWWVDHVLPPELAWLDDEEPPEVVAWCDFVWDVQRQFHKKGELSEKQVQGVLKVYERSMNKEPDPVWVPAPEGRLEVTGVVLSLRLDTYDDGPFSSSTMKALLRVDADDGVWKLWTTVPSSVAGDVGKGDVLHLRVTVSQSRNHDGTVRDETFAIGKRPHLIERRSAE